MKTKIQVLAIVSIVLAGSALAEPSDSEIRAFLKEFDLSPQRVMDRLPKKSRAKRSKTPSFFSPSQIQSRDYVTRKDQLRKTLFPRAVSGGRSGLQENDLAKNLVDDPQGMLTSPSQMTRYRKATLRESPWSDDYWALYTGQLGKRYNDPSFPEEWKEGFKEITENQPVSKVLATHGASGLDLLSPAEKYDLLTGSSNFAFTASNWAQGQYYQDQFGKVETWMGICHGWAVASYMLPRPQKAVELLAADGVTRLKFYPADIKALASLLWAKVGYQARFSGGRCNDKNPKKDSSGRVQSQDCFDTNPGTFHLALVNQIGVAKRSFVMDATYDYEVWNQPIHSYAYTYFNPETQLPGNLTQATVSVNEFSKDKFKRYRSPLTRSVVGVAMEVTYVVETYPTTAETDSAESDGLTSVNYMYDLELDEQGNIIGGEWYQNAHPDFLWTAEPQERLLTDYDPLARGEWNISRPLPISWQKAAADASIQNLPLAKIVEKLIFESQLQN